MDDQSIMNHHSSDNQNGHTWPPTRPSTLAPLPADFYPNGKKSLSGVSLRALLLGITLGINSLLSLQLLFLYSDPLWRPCFFLATLSLFHYLEFDVTARYNTAQANVSAYLLSANGSAYNVAHTAALLEFFARYTFFHRLQWTPLLTVPNTVSAASTLLGIALICLGQPLRTLAMSAAGRSFNHIVQHKKADDHVLITSGVYRWFRHPSYAGYYWWAIGTQLVLGNWFCSVAFAVVLWRFFEKRITSKFSQSIVYFLFNVSAFRGLFSCRGRDSALLRHPRLDGV